MYGHPVLLEPLAEPALGALPELVRAEALLRAGRELGAWLEAERRVLLADERERESNLVVHLVVAAEDVRVVLGQLPDAEHPGQHAGPLLPEEDRVVGEADRQLAVGMRPGLVDQDLLRAVHRLQPGDMVVVVEHEHVVLVVVPVARGLPQLLAHEAGGAHLVEAGLAADLARPVLERPPEGHAARVKERRGRRLGVEGEEVELAADLAVIPLLRLLHAPQVLVELLLRLPGGAVDALEHRARLVAAPVRAGGVEELERAELLRGAEMPAAAEVLEVAVAVEADGRALRLRQVLDDLDLERLIALAHEVDRLGAGQVTRALEAKVGRLLLAHLRLDLLEVGRRQRPRQVEVVVEAVLDGRTDAELRVGEDVEHGGRQHVRRTVTHRREVVFGAGTQGRGRVLGGFVSVDRHGPKGSASARPLRCA